MYIEDLNEEQQAYVDAVLEDGGYWEEEYGGRYKLITRSPETYDCSGTFAIDLYGDHLGFFYNAPNSNVAWNCGDIEDDEEYDLDVLAERAGTCPVCGYYVGVDNMEQVSWAGRACSDCAPEEQRKFQDYINRYGTD